MNEKERFREGIRKKERWNKRDREWERQREGVKGEEYEINER